MKIWFKGGNIFLNVWIIRNVKIKYNWDVLEILKDKENKQAQ